MKGMEHALPMRMAERRRRRGGGRLAVAVLLGASVNMLLLIALAESLLAARDQAAPAVAVTPLTRWQPPPPPPPKPIEETLEREQPSPLAPALPPLRLAEASIDPDALRIDPTPVAIDLEQMPLLVPELPAGGSTAVDAELHLDRGPELLVRPELQRFYPRAARRGGIEGETRVRVQVGADGSVRGVAVLDSRPSGIFDDAARRLCRRLRYRPAERGGQAVPASVTHLLRWELSR